MFVKHTLSFMSVGKSTCLQYPLCHHRFGYFHEAGDIRSFHIIGIRVAFITLAGTLFKNILQDKFQFLVYLFGCPAYFH